MSASSGSMVQVAAGTQERGCRRTVFAGALVGLALLGDSFLYAALPVHYREAGVSLVGVGWLLSLNRWVRFVTNPLAGWLGSRLGWSRAFPLALWLAVAATFGYGCTGSVTVLMILRALWGFSWSILRLGGQAAVLVESSPGRRAYPMGLFTGVYRLGSLAGMVVGGHLADRLGLRGAAVSLAAATALGAVIGSLPPAVSGRWGSPARSREGDPRDRRGSDGLTGGWIPRGSREWAVCGWAATLYLATSGVVTSTVGFLVATRLGPSVTVGPWVLGAGALAGVLLSARWVVDFLLGPGLGRCTDRWGRLPVLGAGVTVIVMMLLVLSRASGIEVIALALVALFAANTGCAAALDGWAGELAGRTPGRFLPVYATWVDAGAAVGPLAGYYLLHLAGITLAYLVSAVLVLSGAIVCCLLVRPVPKRDRAA